jgi:hypothetical protein
MPSLYSSATPSDIVRQSGTGIREYCQAGTWNYSPPRGGRLRTFALARSNLTCNFLRSAAALALVGKILLGAPPGMAVQNVPFKRAVRASMPPYVEEHYRPQPSSASIHGRRPFRAGSIN